MSEELIQRNLIAAPEKIGIWDFYNIGATSLKALKSARIIPDRDYEEFERKKPDALIVNRPQVIAAIEYKQPKELRTPKQIASAILQEIGTAKALGARLYIVTDGQKTIWINPSTGNKITTEDGSCLALNFNKSDAECVRQISKIIASINATNDKILVSAVVDPLPLAQKIWQDLWAVSGATPENCLYTFVELFIFKYLSDLGVLKGMNSFSSLLSLYPTNSEEQVLKYYASSVRIEIKKLFPWNPIDKTTIINGTIFVSKDDAAVMGYSTVFRKILERFQAFGPLDNIDYDFKSKLFETFLKESISKKNWGQFFTPLKVVKSIVNMADITPGMEICDPACGVGKFLLEAVLHDIRKWFKIAGDNLNPQIKLYGFDKGFDKDEQKTIILAKANMLIYMSEIIREHPSLTQQFADLFNATFLLQTNSILGTLAKPEENKYDLILTNPPYVMSGSSNLKEEISKKTPEEILQKRKSILEHHYSISAMGVEGLFMEWIVKALKSGGKAFVVVPDGIMNRANDKRLRNFILDECNIDAVISLPLNTFFTTNKKTYIMALTKKIAVLSEGVLTKAKQSTPVFIYLCSEIGETRDTYRFDIPQNDLDVATKLFNMFKGVRSELPVADGRCKIVGIDNFYDGAHWSVERWWTNREKIELGIEDETNTVSVEQFISIVNETATSIFEFEEPLRELTKKKAYNTTRIRVKDAFAIMRGSGKYTKSYCHTHKGTYPLYSGNTTKAFDEISTFDYDVPCISWAIDGLAGYIMCHDSPFSATNHRGILLPRQNDLDMGYVKGVLEPIFRKIKKGRIGEKGQNEYTSLPPFMIKDVFFDVPVDSDGNFNLTAQHEIAEQHEILSDIKKDLDKKYLEIVNCNIAVDLSMYKMSKNPLINMLDPVRGKSKYTKKYGEANKGNYPVYSASASRPLTYIDTFDYDGEYLSWSMNGFAGTVTVLSGKFSINGDRGILFPKHVDIDIQYLRYILHPIFRQRIKGRRGDKGSDEFTKLYPSMIADIFIPMPIDGNGKLSPIAQKEIVDVYVKLEHYKLELLTKIKTLIMQDVML